MPWEHQTSKIGVTILETEWALKRGSAVSGVFNFSAKCMCTFCNLSYCGSLNRFFVFIHFYLVGLHQFFYSIEWCWGRVDMVKVYTSTSDCGATCLCIVLCTRKCSPWWYVMPSKKHRIFLSRLKAKMVQEICSFLSSSSTEKSLKLTGNYTNWYSSQTRHAGTYYCCIHNKAKVYGHAVFII